MGEHADDHFDQQSDEQAAIDLRRSALLNSSSDQELCEECSHSRNPKIVGIRDYYKRLNKLSEKQRWALADYIATFSESE